MRTQKQILRRIRILYYVFFVIVVISIIASASSRDFKTGFKAGSEMAATMKHNSLHQEKWQFHYLPDDTGNKGYDIPIIARPDSSLIVRGRINMLDIKVQSHEPIGNKWTKAIIFSSLGLGILLYGAVFIVLFIILNSLHRSSKTDNVFARSNISLTRWIGILLIGASILVRSGEYMEKLMAMELLKGTSYHIVPDIPIAFGELLTGILILFVAEIFAIGYDMSQEEQLTI